MNNTDPTGFFTANDAATMYVPFHLPATGAMGAVGSGLGFATGPLSIGSTLLGGGAGFGQAGGTYNAAVNQAAVGGGTGQGGTHATTQRAPVEPLKMPDATPEHLQGPDNRMACRADCYWETRGTGPQLPADARAAVEAGRNTGTGVVAGEVAAGGLAGWIAKGILRGVQLVRAVQAARGGAKAVEQGWKLGGFKSAAKWEGQMAKRGWTPEQITQAMQKGERFAAENLVNKGNAAMRYVHPETGRSVVIDDVTKEVLHVGGQGFKY